MLLVQEQIFRCGQNAQPKSSPLYAQTLMLVTGFKDLIWLSNRVGDDTDRALTSYFVEQAAFEVANRGYDAFEAANDFFETFQIEDDRKIRLELFKVVVKYAQANVKKMEEPAQSLKKDWHVETARENAGELKVGALRGRRTAARRREAIDLD